MPLITSLKRQRREELCEFEARLVYRVSSRTAKATQRSPVLKKKKEKKKRTSITTKLPWFLSPLSLLSGTLETTTLHIHVHNW